MDGNFEVPSTQQTIPPNEETKETPLQDQHNFAFTVDSGSKLDYLPSDVKRKIGDFIHEHGNDFKVQVQVHGDKVSILNQSGASCYILDETKHIEADSSGKEVLSNSKRIIDLAPGTSSTLDNRLSDYSLHFGSKQSIQYYDPSSPDYRIPVTDIFCLAQGTPMDTINIEYSRLVKLFESKNNNDEYLRRRYQVEFNRALRSQRAFMARAGIPEKSIREYETLLLGKEMRVVHNRSAAGTYNPKKGIIEISRDHATLILNYGAVAKILSHEMVHFDPLKFRFIRAFTSAIQKPAALFAEPETVPPLAALEGFTEFAAQLIDGEPVLHPDFKFIDYQQAASIAGDIYNQVRGKKGREYADLVISYFNLGDNASFMQFLNEGLDLPVGTAAGYLYDRFKQFKTIGQLEKN